MLTIKENFKEVMKGSAGKPDRFVKQYEPFDVIMEVPTGVEFRYGETWKDHWGITWQWPEGQLGMFPVHTDGLAVVQDIEKWKDTVKAPEIETSDEAWAAAIEHAGKVDKNEKYVTAFFAPGIFEMTHHLMGIENALMALYEEPEAMEELIEYLTEYELAFAKVLVDKLHPDAILHHDDWGSQISTFVSPAMFEEFFLPAYKKIYGFYKENGVEIIMHHSDSYAATLVPYMIEMGIDVWQGVMNTNNISELVEKYDGQITFMGGLHSGTVDYPNWEKDVVKKQVEETCRANGKTSFIPCQTSGLPIENFEGVIAYIDECIDEMTKEMF